MKKETIIKISKIYDNYSNILLQWKIEPIALAITIFTYQEPRLALKIYFIITLLIHMPGVLYRAFKKVQQNAKNNKEKNSVVARTLAKAAALKQKTVIYTKTKFVVTNVEVCVN